MTPEDAAALPGAGTAKSAAQQVPLAAQPVPPAVEPPAVEPPAVEPPAVEPPAAVPAATQPVPPAVAADPRVPALRIPANRVSRRAIAYWTARSALAGVAILAAESAASVVAGFSTAWLAALAASVAVLAVYAAVMPRWRYRVHRWEVTDTALYTRYVRAWWFTVNWRIAPISRIQTIDSHRSFGERLFGLANVTATTASAAGPIRIHGLDTALADRLLDQLAVATGRTPGDAT